MVPVFTYSALDLADEQTAGTLIADTPVEGRQQLRERGLRIVSFVPARAKRSRVWIRPGCRQRRAEQVAETARYLSLLLRAGVPLVESLDLLTRGRQSKLTTVLTKVRDRVTGGESLGDALAAHGDWFDSLFVSAVRVGELTGNLDESLSELAEHLRARHTLRNQLIGALTYPLILLWVSIGVVTFLMSYVVPQLLTVLSASGRPLPASTMLLKGLSDLLVNQWMVLLATAGLLIAGGAAAFRHERVRRFWQRLQLSLPLIGPLLQKVLVSEFAQHMALLLRTGVPFVEAARTVAGLTGNLVLSAELAAMAKAVESGSDVAPTMEGSRIFPPVVAHLVAVGQSSGELPGMLSELKVRYETEVRLALGRLTSALEPLLIVLLAAMVGFVVFACLMPMLEVTKAIA